MQDKGGTSPGLECAQRPGRDLELRAPCSPERPFPTGEPADRPVPVPGPSLRPPPLPPLAAAVTKRSSPTAVLVRPPLPTARGGNGGASQHPRWLPSRPCAEAAAKPRGPRGGPSSIGRKLTSSRASANSAGPQEGWVAGRRPGASASGDP